MKTLNIFEMTNLKAWETMQKNMVQPIDMWRQGMEFWRLSAELQMTMTVRMLEAMQSWDFTAAAAAAPKEASAPRPVRPRAPRRRPRNRRPRNRRRPVRS